MKDAPELSMLFLTVLALVAVALFGTLVHAMVEIRRTKRQIAEYRRQFTNWQLRKILNQ